MARSLSLFNNYSCFLRFFDHTTRCSFPSQRGSLPRMSSGGAGPRLSEGTATTRSRLLGVGDRESLVGFREEGESLHSGKVGSAPGPPLHRQHFPIHPSLVVLSLRFLVSPLETFLPVAVKLARCACSAARIRSCRESTCSFSSDISASETLKTFISPGLTPPGPEAT